MSHTVHPYSFRIGINRDWKSRWFAAKNYKQLLKTDTMIREWLTKKLRGMFVDEIIIERSVALFNIIIKTSRPGLIIGRAGAGAEKLKEDILRYIRKFKLNIPKDVKLTIEEIKSPEMRARIVAQMITQELERRLPFRRVMKRTLDKVTALKEVKGVKIVLSGRLDGSEMSRQEWLLRGRLPLQTLRSDIDFARERAHLPYGDIGIKVWIYRGEKF